MITETGRTYAYGNDNRLRQVRDDQNIVLGSYSYYTSGQRGGKTAGGVATVYQYDATGQLIGEAVAGAGGAILAEYVYLEGQVLYEAVGGHYIHRDHLGTPEAMTNGAQAKVWDIEAWPFGDHPTITAVHAGLNLRFPGQYFDTESGFHQNGYRDYYPRIGRYIESDPLASLAGQYSYRARCYEAAVGTGLVGRKPIGFMAGTSFYAYVSNNPANSTDPTGLVGDPYTTACATLIGLYVRQEAISKWRPGRSTGPWAHCMASGLDPLS
jgi:RHS repeat-associated protein